MVDNFILSCKNIYFYKNMKLFWKKGVLINVIIHDNITFLMKLNNT